MYMRKLTSQVVSDYDDPVVETEEGRVAGIIVEGTYIFRGVRYAHAKRFHLPEPVEPWKGTVYADHFGAAARELTTPFAHDAYRVPHYYYPQDEDCFFLNIWTPSIEKDEKLPVMVWLHGGMWSNGHSMEIYSYDGENLAREENVVVVGINHRLNVLGYLDLSSYGEEYRYSGDAGLADIVEALRWINRNIEYFGGDPDRVTLFSQSGGGDKALSMLQTPAADGLYHGIIMESGGMNPPSENAGEKRCDDKEYTDILLSRLDLSGENIKQIETVDWYDLATAASEAMYIYRERHNGDFYHFLPVTDNDYFFGHPLLTSFRKETSDIPVMVGSCFSEFSNNYDYRPREGHKNSWSEQEKLDLINDIFKDSASECLSAFKKAYPGRNIADLIFLETRMRKGSLALAKQRVSEGGAPVYNWMFNLEAPFMNGTLPWHNAEEPYVFRNVSYTEAQYEPGVSEELEDIVSGAWASFARCGDPNHDGMPHWDPVNEDHYVTMLFDRECRAGLDHDKELLECDNAEGPGFPHSGFNAAVNGIKPRDI